MNDVPPELAERIRLLLTQSAHPVLVALDGPSGSGKSTLAASIVAEFGAALIPVDEFYAGHIPDAEWDSRTPALKVQDAIDWRRLRAEALEPLLAGRPGRWNAIDYASGPRPDGTWKLNTAWTERAPAAVILLDGAYSARPELADLIALSVLVHAPREVRHARLARREEPAFLASWHARWDAAEDYYFEKLRPASSFDVVVQT